MIVYCQFKLNYFRAVAAGPVSPVSTRDHFFPHSVACPALPTQRHKAHRYHVETYEMAANSATKLLRKSCFQQLSVLTSERLASQLHLRRVWFSADGLESRHQWL